MWLPIGIGGNFVSCMICDFQKKKKKNKQVSFARPSSDAIKGANLYVSGLSKSMTQQDLENLFTPFGQIITSRILCDNITGSVYQKSIIFIQ